MANQAFNEGLGQVAGWARQINNNEPANSAIIVIPWSSTATDAVIKDLNTVADLEADVNTAELATLGWNRKTLSDTGGLTVTVDETNDRVDVDCPDQTWTAVTGSASTDIGFHFDRDTAAGTDANIINSTWHDFAVTPDGSDITAQIAAAGFFRAA